MLKLSVLGSFALSFDDRMITPPSLEKARTLLVYLAIHPGTELTRDRIVDLFWPDAEPERARANLNTALWSLRRCFREAGLDADTIVLASKAGVCLAAPIELDVDRFIALAGDEDPERQHSALAIYRGDFLENCYDDWCIAERDRVARVLETLLAIIVKRSGDVAVAQRLIARNPYGEDAYAALIDAELQAGRPFAAAALADRCRTALDEVGAIPSPAFEARFAALTRPQSQDECATLQLPFVGRERELAALDRAFGAAKNGEPSVVLVHGEAGIGKSVLLAQSGRLARDRDLPLIRVEGDQTGESYGPWPQLFRALTNEELDDFASALTGDAATAIARRIAAEIPARSALIIDDAHQLRGEALVLLSRLVDLCSSTHSLIIGSRPEGLQTLRSLVAGHRVEEIGIGPLGRGAWASALAQATGDPQSELLEAVFHRTEGHPLYFSSLVHSLVEAGRLSRQNGRWQFEDDTSGALELPSTLKNFIETRLRLRGDDPASAACALALEPSASSEELADALGMDEERILDALDDLIALGLLGQPLWGPHFRLSHDLIAEVAASLLHAGRRVRLHRSFASIIEHRHITGSALRRAIHLTKAHSFLAAGHAYADAAEEALQSKAFLDALDRCRAGIDAISPLGGEAGVAAVRARLKQLEALALSESGDCVAAVGAATEAVNDARASLEPSRLVNFVLTRARMFSETLQVEPLSRDSAELLNLANVDGHEGVRVRALCLSAEAERLRGNLAEAVGLAKAALDDASALGDWVLVGTAADVLARSQITWWRFDDASTTLASGLAAASKGGPRVECALFVTRSAFHFALDRLDDARRDLEAASVAAHTQVHRGTGDYLGTSWPWLFFWVDYLKGLIDRREDRYDAAIVDQLYSKYSGFMKVKGVRDSIALLEIDALLARNGEHDADRAARLAAELSEDSGAQTLLGWSDFPALARARVAARLRSAGAGQLLRLALDQAEEHARATPLVVDQAFGALAAAAREAGFDTIATRSLERSESYRSERIAAAGTLWRRAPTNGALR